MAAISVLYTVQVFPGQDADYQQALIGVLFKCVLWEWQFPGVKEKGFQMLLNKEVVRTLLHSPLKFIHKQSVSKQTKGSWQVYWMPKETTHFSSSISNVNVNTFWLKFHTLSTWSIPYTHVRSIWPNQHQIFWPDVIMQFSHFNLVHPYIENRFITKRLPIHLADVKNTLLSNSHCL